MNSSTNLHNYANPSANLVVATLLPTLGTFAVVARISLQIAKKTPLRADDWLCFIALVCIWPFYIHCAKLIVFRYLCGLAGSLQYGVTLGIALYTLTIDSNSMQAYHINLSGTTLCWTLTGIRQQTAQLMQHK